MSAPVENLLGGTRVELAINGLVVLGFSVEKYPNDEAEMIALLREVIAALEAPRVPETGEL